MVIGWSLDGELTRSPDEVKRILVFPFRNHVDRGGRRAMAGFATEGLTRVGNAPTP
jgi:hypothetical protein